MALVRCEEPGCGDWHHPELKAADGTPRCLRHRPVEKAPAPSRRAVLDGSTCDFCREADGAAHPVPPVGCEYESDPEEDRSCRCVMAAP